MRVARSDPRVCCGATTSVHYDPQRSVLFVGAGFARLIDEGILSPQSVVSGEYSDAAMKYITAASERSRIHGRPHASKTQFMTVDDCVETPLDRKTDRQKHQINVQDHDRHPICRDEGQRRKS
jgi:hypothetical protein